MTKKVEEIVQQAFQPVVPEELTPNQLKDLEEDRLARQKLGERELQFTKKTTKQAPGQACDLSNGKWI